MIHKNLIKWPWQDGYGMGCEYKREYIGKENGAWKNECAKKQVRLTKPTAPESQRRKEIALCCVAFEHNEAHHLHQFSQPTWVDDKRAEWQGINYHMLFKRKKYLYKRLKDGSLTRAVPRFKRRGKTDSWSKPSHKTQRPFSRGYSAPAGFGLLSSSAGQPRATQRRRLEK